MEGCHYFQILNNKPGNFTCSFGSWSNDFREEDEQAEMQQLLTENTGVENARVQAIHPLIK